MKLPRASNHLLKQLRSGLTISNEQMEWSLRWLDSSKGGYIEPSVMGGSLGLWNDDMQGLKNAINDIRKEIRGKS